MLQGLRYLLLIEILVLLIFIWLAEAVIAAIGRHRRAVAGGAMGAAPIVSWYVRLNLQLLGRAKHLIGRYLSTYHPAVYRRARNLLIPRR